MSDTATLAAEYLDLKDQITGLEARADEVREQLKMDLDPATVSESGKWEYPWVGAVVQIVAGRTTKRLDRARLVRLGVSAEILDQATITQTFEPTIRITKS